MDFKMSTLILYFVLIFLEHSSAVLETCVPKSFGGSSIVCVCNATSCDYVDPDVRILPGMFAIYVTTKAGQRVNRTIIEKQKVKPFSKDDRSKREETGLTFRLDLNQRRQTIVGFGGTFTDATGINLASLSEGARINLLESYFGAGGMEYTLGTIPIASNDMSTDIYSYDFTQGDTGLAKFTIAGYDHQYKLPFLDEACSYTFRNNLTLFATPWSSPGWMKTNGDMVGFGTVANDMAKVYANYLGRFLQEYESFMFNCRMWGITPQSGPARSCDNTSQLVYQSMCWTPDDMRDWVVQDLKPSLKDYGYDHVKLLVMDDNRDEFPEWVAAFNDTAARNAIHGFAVQAHHDQWTNPALLSEAHAQYPDKIILGSDYYVHSSPAVLLGSWERADVMAKSIFNDLRNYVSGFTHNNLAVNMSGGPSWINNNMDSPIIVDASNKCFYKQPTFYVMGHFSKFVRPGSVGVGLKSDGPVSVETEAVAFLRPDNSVVAVLSNMADRPLNVTIIDGDWILTYTMDPSSIQTVLWWRS